MRWGGSGACPSKNAVPEAASCRCPEAERGMDFVKRKTPEHLLMPRRSSLAATYFPTWCSSIIGARELNFSVRNGKRWILTAITAFIISLGESQLDISSPLATMLLVSSEVFGILVPIDFDITAFRSSAYQRGSLPRPSWKSHLEDGFALRCFQRLS